MNNGTTQDTQLAIRPADDNPSRILVQLGRETTVAQYHTALTLLHDMVGDVRYVQQLAAPGQLLIGLSGPDHDGSSLARITRALSAIVTPNDSAQVVHDTVYATIFQRQADEVRYLLMELPGVHDVFSVLSPSYTVDQPSGDAGAWSLMRVRIVVIGNSSVSADAVSAAIAECNLLPAEAYA
ncbi:MAG TPA: hypothetical protein VLF91_03635 [Candidatus Saccharimonadales bacterium]|nr:hypothetical protein [Candidatus Saccharimonadales bacterium]